MFLSSLFRFCTDFPGGTCVSTCSKFAANWQFSKVVELSNALKIAVDVTVAVAVAVFGVKTRSADVLIPWPALYDSITVWRVGALELVLFAVHPPVFRKADGKVVAETGRLFRRTSRISSRSSDVGSSPQMTLSRRRLKCRDLLRGRQSVVHRPAKIAEDSDPDARIHLHWLRSRLANPLAPSDAFASRWFRSHPHPHSHPPADRNENRRIHHVPPSSIHQSPLQPKIHSWLV